MKMSPEDEFKLTLAKVELELKWLEFKFIFNKNKWLLLKYIAVFGFAMFGVYHFVKNIYESIHN